MIAKEFLLIECKNLKFVLQETLRYEYGLDGSREFYEECETRLAFIEQEISDSQEDNYNVLSSNSRLLNQLSGLISRIERSSLGEYSWPFVEEFKKIVESVCTERTLTNPDSPPKIHVLSDGGLSAYSIYPERMRPSASKKRILTIVFPRTLKHFVLLHPILGHEIGHAIFSSAKHQQELKKIISEELIHPNEKLKSQSITAEWLYSDKAPDGVKRNLVNLHAVHNISEKEFFKSFANWDAWVEEILCDFIGLLIFGPSFLGAHCDLLYSIDPSGMNIGTNHPLTGCRVNMLLTAAELLSYENITFDAEVQLAATGFWQSLKSKKQDDQWFDIFTKEQIKNVIHRLSAFLQGHEPALYPQHDVTKIQPLVKQLINLVPPVGYSFSEDRLPKCHHVDFRHILYAGWITSEHQIEKIPFDTINRLCEHGIMQQSAIRLSMNSGT